MAIKRARHLALLPYAPEHLRVTGSVAGNSRISDDEDDLIDDEYVDDESDDDEQDDGDGLPNFDEITVRDDSTDDDESDEEDK